MSEPARERLKKYTIEELCEKGNIEFCKAESEFVDAVSEEEFTDFDGVNIDSVEIDDQDVVVDENNEEIEQFEEIILDSEEEIEEEIEERIQLYNLIDDELQSAEQDIVISGASFSFTKDGTLTIYVDDWFDSEMIYHSGYLELIYQMV